MYSKEGKLMEIEHRKSKNGKIWEYSENGRTKRKRQNQASVNKIKGTNINIIYWSYCIICDKHMRKTLAL